MTAQRRPRGAKQGIAFLFRSGYLRSERDVDSISPTAGERELTAEGRSVQLREGEGYPLVRNVTGSAIRDGRIQGGPNPGDFCVIDNIVNLLFRCAHVRLTRPFSPMTPRGASQVEAYVVCLDCGKQF